MSFAEIVIRMGEKQYSDLAVFASLHFVDKGPGCQSTRDGWDEQSGRTVTLQLFRSRCSMFEVPQKKRSGKICLWVS